MAFPYQMLLESHIADTIQMRFATSDCRSCRTEVAMAYLWPRHQLLLLHQPESSAVPLVYCMLAHPHHLQAQRAAIKARPRDYRCLGKTTLVSSTMTLQPSL